ncbi:MAG TPA: DUF4265 domain-containing protein [Candidatus Saccharimonadales bacterium]|jgi:hypothetical protein|nr:DUF4265 domain-containing protein [Candidatus Saccharimonadales bacterium]
MAENMVKVTISLPENNLAGAVTESVWAEPQADGTYRVRNVPFYAKGISYGDLVEAEPKDGLLMFKGVAQHSGHSTYRIFANGGRTAPDVLALVETLKKMHCDIEPATDKLVGVDVLPEADIYKVYATLEQAEREGKIDFQEGHCGHPLRA